MTFSNAFLDEYEVLDLLGEGGMGRVYRARQRALGRLVAVKVVKLSTTEDRARFVRESRALAALDHPAILRVIDAGLDGDEPYQICELVEGRDALAAANAGQLDRTAALHVVCEVADGLAYAHARGIVHRDVKPENVFLGEGVVKLADFGLARPVESGHTLTAAGMVLGTPAYLAPEVIRGERATPASDQYALGVMAYQLIAGKMPFAGESFVATLQAHIDGAHVRLDSAVPGLEPHVVLAIERAIAREPGGRHATVAEFAAALRHGEAAPVPVPASAAPQSTRPMSRPVPRPRVTSMVAPAEPRRAPAIAVALALLACAGWFGLKPSARPRPRPTADRGTPVPDTTPSRRARPGHTPTDWHDIAREIARRGLPVRRGPAARDELIRATPEWRAAGEYLTPYAKQYLQHPLELADRVLVLNAIANLRAFDAILRNAGLQDLKSHELLGVKFAPGVDVEDLHATRRVMSHPGAFRTNAPKDDPLADIIDNQPRPFTLPAASADAMWLEVQLPRLRISDAVWLHLTFGDHTVKLFIDEVNEPRDAYQARSGVAFQRLDPRIFQGEISLVAREENVSGRSDTGVLRLLGVGFHASTTPAAPLSLLPGVDLAGRWRFETTFSASGHPLSTGVVVIEPRGKGRFNQGTVAEVLLPGEPVRTWDRVRVHATESRIRMDRCFSMGGDAYEIQTWFLEPPRDEHPRELRGHAPCVPGETGSDELRFTRLPDK